MKYSRSFNPFILWILFFLIFILFFTSGIYSNKYVHTVLPAPEIRDQIPAGELIDGFRLEQKINWDLFNISKLNGSDTLCINLLMANYSNRINTGVFSLSLKTQNSMQKIFINAGKVSDNADQHFCFEKIPLSDAAYKPATLILEGVSSPSGKAVTAWLTPDTVLGKAQRDSVTLDKSLIFSVDVMTKSTAKLMQIILLTALCGLSTSILFWPSQPGFPKDATAESDQANNINIGKVKQIETPHPDSLL